MRKTIVVAGLILSLSTSRVRAEGTYDQRSLPMRALLTTTAVLANITPGLSAVYAKRCLPGYLVCKASFAGMSVILAAEQVLMSGASDMKQTNAILHRGFAGDWFLTGRHVNGDVTPDPWPDAVASKQ